MSPHKGADPSGSAPPPPPSSPKKSFSSLFNKAAPSSPVAPILLPTSFYKGVPSVKISKEALATMSQPLQLSLIGKFSHGQPTMERPRLLFSKLGLTGGFALGH